MSLLQKYLRDGGTLAELKAKYAIDATRHKTYNNLVLLKYNQIESPFAEPLVREARGIILNEADNWNIVCMRFSKFFNHGEGHAAPIDWTTAKVQEKLDGSLMTIYFYDGRWQVASSGSPDASGNVHGFDFTFAHLFWDIFYKMGLSLPSDHNLCLSFELTSKYNRVVVPHKKDTLTLIGIHDRALGKEVTTEYTADERCPVVQSYPLTSFDAIIETFAKIDPLSQEGYVVVDANFNRVKIKHPGYVALHHLKDSLGPRRIVEVIRASETTEVLTYFPEWTNQFNDTQKRYDWLVKHLEDTYAEIAHIHDKKQFALALQARKPLISGALYMLKAGKIDSIKKFIANMNIRNLMEVMGVYDNDGPESGSCEMKFEAEAEPLPMAAAEAMEELVDIPT